MLGEPGCSRGRYGADVQRDSYSGVPVACSDSHGDDQGHTCPERRIGHGARCCFKSGPFVGRLPDLHCDGDGRALL